MIILSIDAGADKATDMSPRIQCHHFDIVGRVKDGNGILAPAVHLRPCHRGKELPP